LLKEQRWNKILEILKGNGAVSSSELANLFQVTHETIRKDLDSLARQGLLERTFGGAILSSTVRNGDSDPPLELRNIANIQEKIEIGRCAAALIQPNDTVALDSSTTTLQLAKHIPENIGVSVITNALFILCELVKKKGIQVISVGGYYRSLSTSFLGGIALRTLEGFNINKAFLSGNAFSVDRGLMDPNEVEPEFKRKMIEIAQESILMVDHTKFGRIAPFTVCRATAFSTVISDRGLPEEHRQALSGQGIVVRIGKQKIQENPIS
jgi:DeoR family fructose operon transcriptional repressor